MMRRRLLVLSFLGAAGAGFCAAQAVKFEVASVKAVKVGTSVAYGRFGGPGTSNPGRFHWAGATLADLLTQAYGVKWDEVIGPGWIADQRGPNMYVVDATMPPGTTKEQFQLMLQGLLKERFRLAVHREVRPFPGYDLVVSPRGAKLKPGGSLPKDAPTFIRRDSARHENRQMSVAQLADELPIMISESLGVDATVRVRDMTGLKGRFDSSLEYSCVAGCGPPPAAPPRQPGCCGAGAAGACG
jgi:uncharacterized protein (TIGR03435 family)